MKQSWRLVTILLGLIAWSGASTAADEGNVNAIEKIQVKAEADVTLIRIDMAHDFQGKPPSWSVIEPPRIVLDFPKTENRSGKTNAPINEAGVKSFNIVETEHLTRLVLNLQKSTPYTISSEGKVLHVRLERRNSAETTDSAAKMNKAQATASASSAAVELQDRMAMVRDIGFRRGSDNQAIVTIDLSDGTVPVDVRREGDVLRIEMPSTELPEKLRARRDVNDFATPVKYISSTTIGKTTRIDLSSKGAWFHQSSMMGNQLQLEIKNIPQSDQNKLVQAGQQGQKVSINFFDAEATMILRTLAEISKKNVLIDPSLSGRKVTVTLDNIAYDRALEIVMAQANAAMRVKPDIIFFGDRGVLQKRDMDSAEEAARANETAPIVSETFTLNYLKPSDAAALIRLNVAGPVEAPGTAAPAAGGAPAQSAPTSSAKGMLSPRGIVTTHDLTKKLFVRDTAAVIESIREMIQTIDVPQRQVMIEARIVSASTGTTNSLGARLTMFNTELGSLGGYKGGFGTNLTPTYGNTNVYGQAMVPSLVTYSPQLTSGISLPGAANAGLLLLNGSGTKLLGLEISANEKDNKAKALSAPRVVTESGKEATISTTTTQTYLSGVNNGTATYAQCVGPIALKVTPTISRGSEIQLALDIQRGNARIITIGAAQGCESSVDAIKTNLTIEDGGTVVIGGVIIEDESNSVDRLPFFGDLPYVGFLFKSTGKQVSRKELLIFLTPRIVKGNEATPI
jgi:type IV pilus assembly protein PilQ